MNVMHAVYCIMIFIVDTSLNFAYYVRCEVIIIAIEYSMTYTIPGTIPRYRIATAACSARLKLLASGPLLTHSCLLLAPGLLLTHSCVLLAPGLLLTHSCGLFAPALPLYVLLAHSCVCLLSLACCPLTLACCPLTLACCAEYVLRALHSLRAAATDRRAHSCAANAGTCIFIIT